MPSGIILASSSAGATEKDIRNVLEKHGYEAPTETPAAPVEPKREDFESEEDFEAAMDAHEQELEEHEAASGGEEREEEGEEEEEERQDTPPRRPSRRQRAVEAATAPLKQQIANLERQINEMRTKPAEALKEPKREDFPAGADGDKKFNDAMDDYKYKARRAREEQEAATNKAKELLEANANNFRTQVAAFKKEHADWDQVVGQPINMHDAVFYHIQELDNGAAVTYYLGQHPDEARKLYEMTPTKAVVAVSKISEKLATDGRRSRPANRNGGGESGGGSSTTSQAPPRKKLPPPVTPTRTAAASSTMTSAEAAKAKNFKAFKAAQRAGR